MKVASAIPTLFMICTSSCVSASAFNGTIKGTVDGHAIDVAAVCEREIMFGGPWLRAKSDPAVHDGAKDRDGDGIAVIVSASQAQGQAVFEVLVAGQTYKFAGKRDLKFTDSGIKLESEISKYDGPGRDAKRIGSYVVNLSIDCVD